MAVMCFDNCTLAMSQYQIAYFNTVTVLSRCLGSSRVLTPVSRQMSLFRKKCLDSITAVIPAGFAQSETHVADFFTR